MWEMMLYTIYWLILIFRKIFFVTISNILNTRKREPLCVRSFVCKFFCSIDDRSKRYIDQNQNRLAWRTDGHVDPTGLVRDGNDSERARLRAGSIRLALICGSIRFWVFLTWIYSVPNSSDQIRKRLESARTDRFKKMNRFEYILVPSRSHPLQYSLSLYLLKPRRWVDDAEHKRDTIVWLFIQLL